MPELNDYSLGLRAYVMRHSRRSEAEAEAWLDEHCPCWRLGVPPPIDGVIWADPEPDDEDDGE